MKNSRLTVTTLLALGISTAPMAHAKDGFSIGSLVSNGTFGHTIERNTGSNTSPSLTTFTQESDYGFGVSAGYQFHLSDDFFVGADLFYQDQRAETRNINNLLITELSLNESYGIKFKAGVDVTDKFAVYGIVGQTTLNFEINNSYPFAPPTRNGDTSVDEVTLGIGAEVSMTDNWSFIVEYNQLNDVRFDPLPEVAVPGKINDNDVDFSALSFGLNYNF